jgi:glucokinase
MVAWLLADLGGTNSRFALARPGGRIEGETSIPTATSSTLTGLVRTYLDQVGAETPKRACVACAGPIVDDRVKLTNARLEFSVSATREELGFDQLQVVNDFAAIARALPALSHSDLVPLGAAAHNSSPGPRLAVGPGTGLGVAAAIPGRGGWTVLPGEGGHVSFSGLYDDELDLIKRTREEVGFVSAEMLLSGPGLSRMFVHLAAARGKHIASATASRPDQIVMHALEGADPTSVATLSMFCRLLAVVASNAALTTGATGGVFLAGGIVRRFPDFLARSDFRDRFVTHPQQRRYLTEIATSVVVAPEPGLLGALQFLLDEAGSPRSRPADEGGRFECRDGGLASH